MDKKVAIITTHPIQYYAPLFKLLSQNIEVKVFYTWGTASLKKFDPGFGKKVEWDIPLLEGYNYEFLENNSKEPGSHKFSGIVNSTIINKIETYNPSLLLVIGWCYNSHLKVLRHFKGKIPIYFRGDSTLLGNNGIGYLNKGKTLLRKIVLLWVYKHVDKVFCVGSASKAYFKWVGIKESNIIFAPHSIDNNRFSIDYSTNAKQLRKQLLIPEEERILLFAGKLEPTKNPILLIQAFINANSKALHLIFLGNGKEEEVLKKIAEESTKKGFIHFVNFQNQSMMPIWYNVSDVFCLTSKGETWGLVVNESMVCGKAIIASDKVGCAEDLVQNGVNGWVFKSGSQIELKQILENIPSKDELLKMGERSKKIIKNWSIEETALKMLKEWERF